MSVGKTMRERLIAAAKRGVESRPMLDASHSRIVEIQATGIVDAILAELRGADPSGSESQASTDN